MNNYPHDNDRPVDGYPSSPQNGSRDEQLTRLDQLERDIAAERERLNRPQPDTSDRYNKHSEQPREEQEQWETVREVNLPDLETKVTESQREAWALGYQAGLSDMQSGGTTTANPFHPLRQQNLQSR